MMLYVSDNVKRMDIVDQLSEGFKKTYDWLTSPIGKLPDAPQATTHAGKVLAGVYEGVKPAVEAVESPLGIGLAGLAAWKPQLAARFAQAYAPVGAYGALKELEGIDPSKQDEQEIARRISSGFVQGLGSLAGIKAGVPKYLPGKEEAAMIAWHGSPKGGITEFSEDPSGIYFSDKPSVARSYTYKRGPWISRSPEATVYKSDLDYSNPMELNAMGARNNNIPYPGEEYKKTVFGNLPKNAISVEEAAKRAFEKGHDALIVRNVMDAADPTNKTKSTVYVVRSPKQVKILESEKVDHY